MNWLDSNATAITAETTRASAAESTNAADITTNAAAIATINTLADGKIYLGDSSDDAQEVTTGRRCYYR